VDKCKCHKPNRTKARVFTARDVRRIAKYAIDDGASPVDVLAGVAVFAGFGWILCVASRALDNSLSILRWAIKVGGIVAIQQVLDFLLTVVSKGLYKKLPKTTLAATLIILVLSTAEDILKALSSLLDDALLIDTAVEPLHQLCSRAKEISLSIGEDTQDFYNKATDYVDNLL
jgi:hypothetical protein